MATIRGTAVQRLLLLHTFKLSIIGAAIRTARENALAKSQWSFKTATELSAALAAKKVSAVELAEDAIGRIERHDTKINAICVRDFDRALALRSTKNEKCGRALTISAQA